MSTNRRDFIKIVVAGAVAAGCPVDLSVLAQAATTSPELDSEQNTICHQVRDGHHFSIPPVSKRHEVVIVGGGVSGLAAAYLLQHHDFLLLEKEPHWGGNAYEMNYNGAIYATGAAFLESPTAADLAVELGLKPLPIDNWDPSIIKGEFIPDTWGDGLDRLPYPEPVKGSFKKFKKDMLAIDIEKRGKELDAVPLSDLLRDYAPEVKEWWDTYAPSNWGGLSQDSSAAVAIDEFQGIAGPNRKDTRTTWPGGNGALTAKLAEVLNAKHRDRMLSDATTIAVAQQGKEVHVTYIQNGRLKSVAAKGVIMATPKFITSRIVAGIPETQKDAMAKIRYAPYPVVNLIFDKPVYNKGYDTWCPGNTFTDFIVADWVVRKQPGYKQKNNILTFYAPLAEVERKKLLKIDDCRQIAASVLRDFQKLLPEFAAADPVEVHFYRRGHPMFVATPGTFTKIIPTASQPLERVFFANTDSIGPESEISGAVDSARKAAEWVEKRLAGVSASGARTAAGLRA